MHRLLAPAPQLCDKAYKQFKKELKDLTLETARMKYFEVLLQACPQAYGKWSFDAVVPVADGDDIPVKIFVDPTRIACTDPKDTAKTMDLARFQELVRVIVAPVETGKGLLIPVVRDRDSPRFVLASDRQVEELAERVNEHGVGGDGPRARDGTRPHAEQEGRGSQHHVDGGKVVEVGERELDDVSPLARDDRSTDTGGRPDEGEDQRGGARPHDQVRSEPGRAAERGGEQGLAPPFGLLGTHGVQGHDGEGRHEQGHEQRHEGQIAGQEVVGAEQFEEHVRHVVDGAEHGVGVGAEESAPDDQRRPPGQDARPLEAGGEPQRCPQRWPGSRRSRAVPPTAPPRRA